MITMKEKRLIKAPYNLRISELRTSSSGHISDSIDNVALIFNEQIDQLHQYKKVDCNQEWSSFLNLVEK